MTRKHDALGGEQNRDPHPEREPAGSPAAAQAESSPDAQQPGTGKVANDHNKQGAQAATQLNQGRRTPESRSDRENLSGGPQSTRQGRGGAARGPRGAG